MFRCQIWKYLPNEREFQVEKIEMSFFRVFIAIADKWVWYSKWVCLLPISEYYILKSLFFGEFSIHTTPFSASSVKSVNKDGFLWMPKPFDIKKKE